MRRGASLGMLIAGAASIVAHGIAGALLVETLRPEPIDQQTVPETSLDLIGYDTPRGEIIEKDATGAAARAAGANPKQLSQGTIRRLAVPTSPPPTAYAAPQQPAHAVQTMQIPESADPTVQAAPASLQVPSGPLTFDRSAVIKPVETALDAPSEPVGQKTATLAPRASNALLGETITPDPTPAATLKSVALMAPAPYSLELSAETDVGPSVPATPPPQTAAPWRNPVSAEVAASTEPPGPAIGAPSPSGPFLPAVRPASPDAPERSPPAISASAGVPDSLPVTAGLAWSGAGEDSLDPVSLAAIHSFVTEEDLRRPESATLRDGIADLLAQVPCARLQVAFDPESGALALRGHVPEAGLRGPVAEALRAQVGGSIPVVDVLQVLPRPQCGALAGMATAGLPQSTDQETDPRLVGEGGYSSLYRYVDGDRMIFDITAPDYDAWVYVDYFDASGMVVHLVPNADVLLERHPAKSEITVGADRADGNFMAVTVGPPYGQEIAVAFATSAPLYETARATVERAEPYLVWLRDRIAQARASDPDFKGEWVYFLVESSRQ